MDGPLPPPLGDMLMILPKGIVENTAEIYAEVASYPVVPPEKICEYWHVYTTTFRKLVDPTASRLENFWWHVWGSDRRYLSGRTLAKIYEEISTGPTIAPLRCPLNRYEGPPTPRRSQHELDGQREKERKQIPEREHQGSSEGQDDDGDADASPPPKKERTSSSAKPPPTHSILKKPRGPLASGPRPTARFISPHASEDEAKKDDEGSSGSTAVAGQEMRRPPPPVKSDKKSGASSTKKFVASSSASKRRPALTRRPSSQSSTGSDVNFRDAGSSSGSRSSAVQRGLPPPIAENATSRTAVPRSQGSSASSTQGSVLSAKTAGKRPAATRTASDRRAAARGAPASVEEERPVVVQAPTAATTAAATAAGAAAAVPQRSSHSEQPLGPADSRRNMEVYEATRLRRDSSRSTAQAAGVGAVVPPTTVAAAPASVTATTTATTTAAATAPRMARSQSSQADHHYQQQRHRDLSLGRPPPQGLVASSIAATSQVAAQGQFDSENSDPAAIFAAAAAAGAAADSLSHVGTPSGGLTSRPSSSSLLEPRFTPTQPNPAPAVPFGRSKSQLTLLLEREKARIGDLKPKTTGGDGDEP